jgi:flagellum-specific ATP synthase
MPEYLLPDNGYVVGEDHKMYADFVRELISTYRKSEDLIMLNAYVKGSDPKTDLAISKKTIIDEFLTQKIEQKVNFQDMLYQLRDIFLMPPDEEL